MEPIRAILAHFWGVKGVEKKLLVYWEVILAGVNRMKIRLYEGFRQALTVKFNDVRNN